MKYDNTHLILGAVVALILILVTCIGAFAAPFLPYPIAGKSEILGDIYVGQVIEVKNIRTGMIMTGDVNSAGEYLIDLANMPSGYVSGDSIEVSICKTNSACKQTFKVEGAMKLLDIIVKSGDMPQSDIDALIAKAVENYKVNNPIPAEKQCVTECPSLSCPKVEQPVCIEKQCEVCKEPVSCPVDDKNDINGLLAGLFGTLLAAGGSYQLVKNAKGAKLMHKHKGILGYHDANTKHTNVLIRHALLKDNPSKFMSDMAKLEKDGKL